MICGRVLWPTPLLTIEKHKAPSPICPKHWLLEKYPIDPQDKNYLGDVHLVYTSVKLAWHFTPVLLLIIELRILGEIGKTCPAIPL